MDLALYKPMNLFRLSVVVVALLGSCVVSRAKFENVQHEYRLQQIESQKNEMYKQRLHTLDSLYRDARIRRKLDSLKRVRMMQSWQQLI